MRSRAISRAFRHLHDTNFEEIQHIDRRPGDSHNLMCHLASSILSVIDAAKQDDFYSPIIEAPSFYEAYFKLRKISVNGSWNDCQVTFGYQLETLPTHGRSGSVLTGCQIEALQQRHYSWSAMARALRVSYLLVLVHL